MYWTGTGTGSLARGFARGGCKVIGLDPAEPLLAKAKEIDASEGVDIEYRVGCAEETGLPSDSFHIVAAGQCWHWFKQAEAAAEAADASAQQVLQFLNQLEHPMGFDNGCDWLIYFYDDGEDILARLERSIRR